MTSQTVMQTSLIIVVMTTHRLSLSHHYLNGIVRDDAAGAANSTTVWLFMSVSHQVLSILGVSTFRLVWHATDVALTDVTFLITFLEFVLCSPSRGSIDNTTDVGL